MTESEDIQEALNILQRYNPLHHDLDAYLYEVILWAQGRAPRPNPKDYGVEVKP